MTFWINLKWAGACLTISSMTGVSRLIHWMTSAICWTVMSQTSLNITEIKADRFWSLLSFAYFAFGIFVFILYLVVQNESNVPGEIYKMFICRFYQLKIARNVQSRHINRNFCTDFGFLSLALRFRISTFRLVFGHVSSVLCFFFPTDLRVCNYSINKHF